ncbi:MAG: hypothetical protein U1G05_02545 [Kiritimatiellia bacterium]
MPTASAAASAARAGGFAPEAARCASRKKAATPVYEVMSRSFWVVTACISHTTSNAAMPALNSAAANRSPLRRAMPKTDSTEAQ